jgi:Flp pilus assembly protein TadD
MMPANIKIFRKIVFYTVLLLFCCIRTAAAHIEKGSMPDSVAEMEFRILLEFEPDNLDVRNQLGMVLYRSGRLEEAKSEFHAVLEKAPENFDATDALGLVNLKQANHHLAIGLFKKAIAINPADMLVYYHLGQALEQLGDTTEAADAYRTGLSLETTGPHRQTNAEQRLMLLDALKNIQTKAVKAEEDNE